MLTVSATGAIRPVFQSPLMELGRLLRQAAEVEHALLVQYLYAAFSIKPEYPSLHGFPMASSGTMLGVAIQEMQHLDAVNNFLVALRFAPNLTRQDFPWEPEIYPFPLHLEPLSKRSSAKYLFTEAPGGTFDPKSEFFDGALDAAVRSVLGNGQVINHVGSLYGRIISLAQSVAENPPADVINLGDHVGRMQSVKSDGEVGHFHFFRSVFDGTHPGFEGAKDPWSIPAGDASSPVIPLPMDPTALNWSTDKGGAARGRFSNLHYWLTLAFLDGYYRFGDADLLSLAKAHMLGPLLQVGGICAADSQGLPFDVLDFGYAFALDAKSLARGCLALLNEADAVLELIPEAFVDLDNSQAAATRSFLEGRI